MVCPPLVQRFAVAVLLASPLPVHPQAVAHQHEATPASARAVKLGTIRFPTSASGAAQADFIEGVLYLHSFEYESARTAFRRAQQKAPNFAMAYWGDAQTWNHPVWNQRDADSARAALARLAPTADARAAKASTPRERAWLETVEVLYGDGPKPLRDSLYLRRMQQLAQRHPDDEAQVFLALAWLGLNQGDRRVSDYMQAGAIAQRVFTKNPDHPGAAHFVIHAFDDPEHAVLALDAARAYSRIAPAAAHAQHMTTHIFLALGMWPENNDQNTIAFAASGGRSGHYGSWLAYGYQQQGRFDAARALLDSARAALARPRSGLATAWPMMRAWYVVDRDDWSLARDASLLASSAGFIGDQVVDAWLYAMGAARSGDGAAALAGLERLRALEATAAATARVTLTERQVMSTMRLMAEGAEYARGGDTTRALATLAAAQATRDSAPVAFGPPDTPMLVSEQRGELLLAAGRAREAMAAAQLALRSNPGRSRSLALLARAASAVGDAAAAEGARAQLARNWANADDRGAGLRALEALAARR
jgi:tetratricopeptide (TPR) repeat protein